MPKTLKLQLPIIEWNLEHHTSALKIGIEEVDNYQTTKSTVTTTCEFASNFEFNPTLGETNKIGTKFGKSSKITKTISYEVTTILESDKLGEVIINFGDDIILSKGKIQHLGPRTGDILIPDFNNKYYTGWYKLSIAPFKMN